MIHDYVRVINFLFLIIIIVIVSFYCTEYLKCVEICKF